MGKEINICYTKSIMTESPKDFREGRTLRNILVIDNGADKILLEKSKVSNELSHAGVTEDTINRMLEVIEQFVEEVSREKSKGVHLGSTELDSAVGAEFWNMKPEDLGFKTDLELKLAARLIAKLVERKP